MKVLVDFVCGFWKGGSSEAHSIETLVSRMSSTGALSSPKQSKRSSFNVVIVTGFSLPARKLPPPGLYHANLPSGRQ